MAHVILATLLVAAAQHRNPDYTFSKATGLRARASLDDVDALLGEEAFEGGSISGDSEQAVQVPPDRGGDTKPAASWKDVLRERLGMSSEGQPIQKGDREACGLSPRY